MDHDAKVIHWKNEIEQVILNTQALYPAVENSSIQSMVETTNRSNVVPQISSTPCDDTRSTTAAHASVSESIRSQSHLHPSLIQTYKLEGDNLDKEVKPCHMRSDHQTRTLHYFYTYAIKDRIDLSAMSDQTPSTGITSTHLSTLLPTSDDNKCLQLNFSILMAHVVQKYTTYFSTFEEALESHIPHAYTCEMASASEVVNYIYIKCYTKHMQYSV